MKVICAANPDVFRKNYDNDEKLQKVLSQADDDEIRFSQWKRVSVEKDGKVFEKMRLIDLIQSSMEFTESLKTDSKLFSEHAARVKQQYKQIRHLKLHLPANHVIAQMDFAQNYTCQALEKKFKVPTIFNIINHHKVLFGFPASWNYFEAGHGKGPCDGVGGISKQMADQATKQNIKIQSAADFYNFDLGNGFLIRLFLIRIFRKRK